MSASKHKFRPQDQDFFHDRLANTQDTKQSTERKTTKKKRAKNTTQHNITLHDLFTHDNVYTGKHASYRIITLSFLSCENKN